MAAIQITDISIFLSLSAILISETDKMEEDTKDELDGNQLAKSLTYSQTIEISGDDLDDINKSESLISSYIKDVLNDNSLNDKNYNCQIPFYKAEFYAHEREQARMYTINFKVYSEEHWTTPAQDKLRMIYFDKLNKKLKSAKIVSYHFVKSVHSFERSPLAWDAYTEDETPGCNNIPGKNCFEKLLNFWLVVPRVQWDFFDLLYQMYTFDIFHQGVVAKYVHFFTIPANAMLTMMFLAQFNIYGEIRYGGAFAVNVGLIFFLCLGVAYIVMGILRKSWAWGVATFVVLAVCHMTGNLWYYSYRQTENPWYNPTTIFTNPMVWSYAMSIIQASSHMAVPQMPPRISGVQHWESLHVFFMKNRKSHKSCILHILFIIASVGAFPVLSVSVAWFSWPHLIGTEVIYVMAGIGYRPKFFEKYFRIVEKVERNGNPILDRFPTSYKDISTAVPAHVETLKKHKLIGQNATDGEVFQHIATIKLAAMYLRQGANNLRLSKTNEQQQRKTEDRHQDLEILLAARKGFIGKSNTRVRKRNTTQSEETGLSRI